MPNRIQRLPVVVKSAPRQRKQVVVQDLVDGVLRDLDLPVETDEGRKRISAAYSKSGRFWYLEAARPEDESLCKQVLAQIQAVVKTEQPSEVEERPLEPQPGTMQPQSEAF
jgi:hypothetical protein